MCTEEGMGMLAEKKSHLEKLEDKAEKNKTYHQQS